jgi:putative protein kinase ArgK-like GTPase of G3E family
VFIRSMARRDRLGGIAENTWAAVATLGQPRSTACSSERSRVGQSESAVAGPRDTLVFVAKLRAAATRCSS